MSNQYKRLPFQAPKSYEELNKNRPTKKRNFNYTSQQQQIGLQNINIPISSLKGFEKDYSFQSNQNYSARKQPFQNGRFTGQKSDFSPIYNKNHLEGQVQSPLNEKQIDDRLNNINSISSKISSLLSNPQKKVIYKTPLVEKSTNIEKSGLKQFSIKQRGQASSLQPQKANKSKYSYISYEEEPLVSKANFAQNKYPVVSKANFAQNKYQSQKPIYGDLINKDSIKRDAEHLPQHSQNQQYVTKTYRNTQYLYGQQIEKDKIRQQVEQKYQTTLKKQKISHKNYELDLRIEEIKHRILDSSPLISSNTAKPKQDYEKDQQIKKFSQNLQVSKMANKLSNLIQIDIILLKIREAFQLCRQANKWQQLKAQLQSRNIYLTQDEIKQAINISIHEKNPFASKKPSYPLNGFKDLAKLYAQSCRIWYEELQKSISLDRLAQQDFSMSLIDLNHKGTISLQDLVCFVNVNSQKFYRNRDVVPLFKRFLKTQGKSIEKGSTLGVSYGTFMDKLTK